MNKIKVKYEDVTGNYPSMDEFTKDCYNKNILMGAFYITGVSYYRCDYYEEDKFIYSNYCVKIQYSIFDPLKGFILNKVTTRNVRKDYILSDLELGNEVYNFEYSNFCLYLENNYTDLKIKSINDGILEIEYL